MKSGVVKASEANTIEWIMKTGRNRTKIKPASWSRREETSIKSIKDKKCNCI
jgi:hypothetical protein